MGLIQKIIQYFNNRKFNKDFILKMKEFSIDATLANRTWLFSFPEKVYCRPFPSSDFSVFLQVFYHQQYQQIVSLAKLNSISLHNVIDLGANVGYTSIYLHKNFKDAQIYAIEPDDQNYIQLLKNTEQFKAIHPLKLAIWGHETVVELSQSAAEDWGKSFKENPQNQQGIKAITLSSLMQQMQLETIDLLKMDIEGAEDGIFKGDLSFLSLTKMIALEIHDEQTDRNMIQSILVFHGFLIWDYGELTIGINLKN